MKDYTPSQKIIDWAIADLRKYAADDICDHENLAPLLALYDAGNMPAFYQLGAKCLVHYVACSDSIDQLQVHCEQRAMLTLDGLEVTKAEALQGLGDPADWQAFSDKLNAEYKAKPNLARD